MKAIKIQCKAQLELRALCGNKAARVYSHETTDEALKERVKKEHTIRFMPLPVQAIQTSISVRKHSTW